MIDNNGNLYYIVAGDEMQRLMNARFTDRKTIPFREDFSKGNNSGFFFDGELIRERAAFWSVTEKEYIEKFSPIINLDINQSYILCFGEDDCCRANLKFMVDYLKYKGYAKKIRVQILDEYTLEVQKEYFTD